MRSLDPRLGVGDASLWFLEGGETGMCVMSLPRKAEISLHSGQSSRPGLSAALDALSGGFGRLCGCISLEPGVCSRRHEQANTTFHQETCKKKHKCKHSRHSQWCVSLV